MENSYGENGKRGQRAPIDVGDFKLPPWTGKAIKWGLAGIALVFLIVGISWGRAVYTDWLWFDNIGYLDVFQKILVTRIWLFLAGAGVFALFIAPNIYLVFRLTVGEVPATFTPAAYTVVRRILASAAALVVAIAAVAFGSAAGGRWETILMYINSTPFTQVDGASEVNLPLVDPIFNKGVDFFVFTLPLLGFIRGWMLGAVVVVLVFVLALYLLFFGLRERGFVIPRGIKIHVASIAGILFLVIAAGHWLGRYELLYSPLGVVFGVGFTDENARLTVRTILTGIALISGVLMVAGSFMSGNRLMIGAVGLWVGMAILVGSLFPTLVQRFQVEPNELAKEEPYLVNNIAFTRMAYDVDLGPDQIRNHAGLTTITPEIIEDNRGTIDNIRLWDERPLAEIYNQVEFVQFYYDFQNIGVDRYKLNGENLQVMLSTRELSAEKLPEEAQTWTNRHLVYTHGHGVAMSAVNTVNPNGQPHMFLQDVPTTPAEGFEELAMDQAGVYYGLKSLPFIIVGSKVRELDYQGEGAAPVFTDYSGPGGVALNSFIKRIAYAWQFVDINIFISRQIDTDTSRIQYRRTIPERFDALTPFLIADKDPYQVVSDGRIFFIQDGYTTTSEYPYSTPSDSGEFNYIRNSVKAVIDAYDGTVNYYVFEPNDPIIQTYSKMFPTLFKDKNQMPADLREHVRYPRDLFAIQAEILLQYHIQNPRSFYQKDDQWSIPTQSSFGREGTLDPYYILARLPGEENEEFLLIQPFTPDRRDPLKAWIAVRNDEPNYGEMVMFRFPEGKSILGPNQVEARIDNDAAISQQFTLWGQVGSEVQRGNMLVIPVGDSILYAEPIFLKPEALEFPELRRIILADGQKVVMQPTLEKAIRALKGEIPAVAPVVDEDFQKRPVSPSTPQQTVPGGSVTAPRAIPAEGLIFSQDEIKALRNALSDMGKQIEEIEAIIEQLASPPQSQ